MRLRSRRLLIRATSVLLRGLYRLFGGFQVRGLEHIPKTGAAILAPNHRSWADPPAIQVVVERTCWFMANDFLFRIPVLGKLIPLYGAFPVRREEIDRESIRRAESHLKAGDLLVVFPEGGTTLTGFLSPFEGGVALLALRNDVPIIPVGITGTDRVLPMQPPYYPRYAKGGVTLTFGPPVYPAEVPPDLKRGEKVDWLTRRLHLAVAALLPPEYLPPDFTAEDAESAEGIGEGELQPVDHVEERG